ncbi:MAG: hypothetical protein U0R24_06740 [Solirubrobacterales bacterium]
MSEATIASWLKQGRIDRGEVDGFSTDQALELAAAERPKSCDIGLAIKQAPELHLGLRNRSLRSVHVPDHESHRDSVATRADDPDESTRATSVCRTTERSSSGCFSGPNRDQVVRATIHWAYFSLRQARS